MNRYQALQEAPKRFGREVIVRERGCVVLVDNMGQPVLKNGKSVCSGEAAHGPGCPGGYVVCEIAAPNQAGDRIDILGMGNDWDGAFSAVRPR